MSRAKMTAAIVTRRWPRRSRFDEAVPPGGVVQLPPGAMSMLAHEAGCRVWACRGWWAG